MFNTDNRQENRHPDNIYNWLVRYTEDINYTRTCPICNSNNTESKGKRKLASNEIPNKRHCFDCNKYYYWDLNRNYTTHNKYKVYWSV